MVILIDIMKLFKAKISRKLKLGFFIILTLLLLVIVSITILKSYYIDTSYATASYIGEKGMDYSGRIVEIVGDVNGDGYDDILICSPLNNESNPLPDHLKGHGGGYGQVYLILGKKKGWEKEVSLSNVDASFLIEPESDYFQACSSDNSIAYSCGKNIDIAKAGDVNGDGLDDFLIGSPIYGESGKVYLMFGRAKADWGMDFNLFNADISFLGEAGEFLGASVTGACDINGDGFDDILLGAPNKAELIEDHGIFSGITRSKLHYQGRTYLFLGKEKGWLKSLDTSSADASFIDENKENSGFCVAGVGDVNGDGLDDFLTSGINNAEFQKDKFSKVYLVLGKETANWGTGFSLSNADASFVSEWPQYTDAYTLERGGDVNGDGLNDFFISANDGSNHSGGVNTDNRKVYLFLGRKLLNWGHGFNISESDASFLCTEDSVKAGISIAGSGDINGDGFSDFVIGTPQYYTGYRFKYKTKGIPYQKTTTAKGIVCLFLGRPQIDWGNNYNLLNSDATFVGDYFGGYFGFSLSMSGDLNGDGLSDIAIASSKWGLVDNRRNTISNNLIYELFDDYREYTMFRKNIFYRTHIRYSQYTDYDKSNIGKTFIFLNSNKLQQFE